MLKKLAGYTAAHFMSSDTINPEEVKSADVVTILGKHSGGIYHSTAMRWKCFLGNKQASEIIHSQKEKQSYHKNRLYFLDQGYSFEIKEMNKDDYDEFKLLYENTTQKKERAIRYTLEDKILGRILARIPVYCAGMYKEKKLVSGLVFTISRNNEALVSFGAKQKFQDIRGGVGGVLEWLLLEYCVEHHIDVIDHGKSPNPNGLVNKSGLFEFKARYGNSAYPEGEWVTTYILNPDIVMSELVFVTTINDEVGYVIVTNDQTPNLQKKYLTWQVNTTQIISLDQLVAQGKAFFAAKV